MTIENFHGQSGGLRIFENDESGRRGRIRRKEFSPRFIQQGSEIAEFCGEVIYQWRVLFSQHRSDFEMRERLIRVEQLSRQRVEYLIVSCRTPR